MEGHVPKHISVPGMASPASCGHVAVLAFLPFRGKKGQDVGEWAGGPFFGNRRAARGKQCLSLRH